MARLWAKDHTLWTAEPAPEIEDRLGWLALPETMRAEVPALEAFAAEVAAAGVTRVVLLGMGGSSLAPEVFARTFGRRPGYPALLVLDSTHPEAVRAVDEQADPATTLFVVSSKSGTTIEPNSFLAHCWERAAAGSARSGAPLRGHHRPGHHPGRPGPASAASAGVFAAPPDVGGRFSALTHFGLVPAALIGADLAALLDEAAAMAAACRRAPADNPGLPGSGAVLGELALAGRDKATFLVSPALAALPAWIEQLVAESTGKQGTGILPVAGEPAGPPEAYGDDRLFVYLAVAGDADEAQAAAVAALEAAGHPVVRLPLDGLADLGAEMYRWEVAMAMAGSVLGIHPFDQPDVQLAKALATRAMAGEAGGGPIPAVAAADPEALAAALAGLLAQARPGDYLADPGLRRPHPAGRGGAAGPAPGGARPPAPGHHRGLRAPLPALHRATPQGRPRHRPVPAGRGRRRARPARAGDRLLLRAPGHRPGRRRLRGAGRQGTPPAPGGPGRRPGRRPGGAGGSRRGPEAACSPAASPAPRRSIARTDATGREHAAQRGLGGDPARGGGAGGAGGRGRPAGGTGGIHGIVTDVDHRRCRSPDRRGAAHRGRVQHRHHGPHGGLGHPEPTDGAYTIASPRPPATTRCASATWTRAGSLRRYRWNDDKANFDAAAAVHVISGASVTINATLTPMRGAEVSGTVTEKGTGTPLGGDCFYVELFEASGISLGMLFEVDPGTGRGTPAGRSRRAGSPPWPATRCTPPVARTGPTHLDTWCGGASGFPLHPADLSADPATFATADIHRGDDGVPVPDIDIAMLPAPTCRGKAPTIFGTTLADTIIGTGARDIISGLWPATTPSTASAATTSSAATPATTP